MSLFKNIKNEILRCTYACGRYIQESIEEKIVNRLGCDRLFGLLVRYGDESVYQLSLSKEDKINLEGTFIAIKIGQPPKTSSGDNLSRS